MAVDEYDVEWTELERTALELRRELYRRGILHELDEVTCRLRFARWLWKHGKWIDDDPYNAAASSAA